ncbi:hypothetical protein JCM8097_000018 [Rhodosporidiobolus ruineniae]
MSAPPPEPPAAAASGRPDEQQPTASTSTAPAQGGQGAGDGQGQAMARVRHLRACDRKCDEASPCSRCRAAGTECTFTLGAKILATDNGGSGAAPEEAVNKSKKKRKAETAEPASGAGPSSVRSPAADSADSPSSRQLRFLDPDETATFFTTPEGLARFCGSTSGLPLLEATRRLSRQQPNVTATAKEPDWAWLAQLLDSGRPAQTASPDSSAASPPEDHEFFPGRELQTSSPVEAHNMILEIIPTDLLGVLIHLYFENVHPSWPIIHVPTFLESTHKWREPAFAALVLAMCMLASRYCADPRVRADPNNPSSAGYHYFTVFRRLRDMASLGVDDAVEAIQSLFLCAQYHCVDTLPHPIAQGLFGDAVARVYDGGLHRATKHPGLGTSIALEVRKRTAWAVYILDKQISAVAGRPVLLPLAALDVDTPSPFPPMSEPSQTDENARRRDTSDVQVFEQLVYISAAMERSIAASMQPPGFWKGSFLDALSGRAEYTGDHDFEGPRIAERHLDAWVKQLPPLLAHRDLDARARDPLFSPRTEAVYATEETCRIMLSSRRLQLRTLELTSLSASELERSTALRIELRQDRLQLLTAIKRLVSSGVKLGANGLLWKGDIFLAYRLLLAGRLTLAVVLSAQEDQDSAQEVQARQTLEACVLLLSAFAAAFPVSLGAAETLKETCRVSNVILSKATLDNSPHGRYAWHRPLPRGAASVLDPRQPRPATTAEVPLPTRHQPASVPPPHHASNFSPSLANSAHLDSNPNSNPFGLLSTGLSPPVIPMGSSPANSVGSLSGAGLGAASGVGPNSFGGFPTGGTPFASGSSSSGGVGGGGSSTGGGLGVDTPGGSLEAWAQMLNHSPGASGMGGGGTGATPGASGAGLHHPFGDLTDLGWLFPGGQMPQL